MAREGDSASDAPLARACGYRPGRKVGYSLWEAVLMHRKIEF